MGNTELKAAFKNVLKDSQGKEKLGLTGEILFEDDFVNNVEEFIKEKMGVSSFEKEKAFPETNIQTNENASELYKSQLISQLTENYISGFSTAESNIEFLKEPSFEKTFTVNAPDNVSEYTKLQQQKFFILYALFVEKFRDQQDKKQNFFDYIQKFLEKEEVGQRVQVGLETGFKFSLSLLREIQHISPDLLVNSLEYLHQTLRNAEPGSLYSTDKLSFMVDSNLNDVRSFLVSIIEKQENKRAIQLSFKILLLIGAVRSNVEDFLILANLLNKYQGQASLKEEFNIIKEDDQESSATSDSTSQKKNFSERKITKSATSFFLKKNPLNDKVSFACDSKYLYVHQEGLGLVKMSVGQSGQMLGQVFGHNSSFRSGEKVYLLYLNGKLYCRAEGIKPKPFVVVNTDTLEEEKDEFELDKEDQNLEWKESEETGRSLTVTPLLTDGNYIYVIAQKKTPKKKKETKEGEEADQQEDEESQKPPVLIVECYDPQQASFPFVKQVQLYKNKELEPFMKSSNSVDFIKSVSFATTGQILFMQREKKAYFFDMKTGILIQKVVLEESHQSTKVCFDYQNSIFYKVPQSDGIKIDVFTIANFKKSGATSGFEKQYLQKRLNNFKGHVYKNQENSSEVKSNPNKLNIIQRIMKNVTLQDLLKYNRENDLEGSSEECQYLRVLILNFIDKACSNFSFALEDVKSQGKSANEAGDNLIKFFKFPNATYLTCTVFQQIQENLESNADLISDLKSSANLNQQYSFYYILKILTANFQALSYCSVSLPDLMDDEAYQRFLTTYKTCVVRIIEKGYNQEFESGEHEEEMKQLWTEIYQICLNILSTSINLIYSDNKEIIKNLEVSLADVQNEKQAENSSISLNFLSMPENCRKLLQVETEQLQFVTNVFEKCCQIKSQYLIKSINDNKLGEVKSSKTDPSKLVQGSSKFIQGISEQLIVQYGALSEQIASKQGQASLTTEKDEKDKNRLKEFENLISFFFDKICGELANSVQAFATSLQTTIENKKDDEWDGINEKYEKFQNFIHSIVQYESTFFSIINLYVQTFSICKIKSRLIAPITHSITQLLNEISAYFTILKSKKFTEKITLGDDKDKLKKCLELFSRTLSWFIGMTAYKLIKIKEPEKEKEKDSEKKEKESSSEKMQELIISSNLLSGGIENRFLILFPEEVQQNIQDLINVASDKELKSLIKQQSKISSEDDLLQAVITDGKSPVMDRVIKYLQQIIERKIPIIPYARIAGQDGMRMSRAAFAVLIKFSEYFEDFTLLVDEVDLKYDEVGEVDDRDAQVKEHMKTCQHYEQIVKRWESATKMRQWIMEKKKNLIEKIRKDVENEYIKKKDEDKKKKEEEEQKKKEEEEKKKEEDEKKKKEEEEKLKQEKGEGADEQKPNEGEEKQEQKDEKKEEQQEQKVEEQPKKEEEESQQIDTSSKKEEEKPAENAPAPAAEGELTEQDKQNIDDIADQKFNVELQKIFDKIVEKAELLIKLVVPTSYLVKDPNIRKTGTLLFIKETEVKGEQEEKIKTEIDWRERLQNWKQMQTSKGAIKSFTDRKKEIFDSSVMSILSCLQTPITAQRIKKQVETVFVNGCKRVAGLKILGDVMKLELPQKQKYDLINWFCSSLRANKNQVTHYLDDLKGCGHHIEEQAKVNFFLILKALVAQLKESKDDDEIKVIINALKWKYIARDHMSLKSLEIFKTLHQGNNDKDNKIKKAWGRQLKLEVAGGENDKKVSQEVLELFEEIFLMTVGRIIRPDTGSQLKLKQKGTSIPTLEKAQSVIDENVSERLFAEAFDVIFKEFDRYIKIMGMYKGVDWGVYVKTRNKERKNGDSKKEYDQDKLLDEEEEQQQEDKKEESDKKEEGDKKEGDEKKEGDDKKEDDAKKEGDEKKDEVQEKKEEEPKVDGEKKEEKVEGEEKEKKEEGESGEKKEESAEGEKKEGEEKEKKDGEEGEDKKEEEEQKEKEDIEQKQKEEVVKKQDERAEREMKSIYKLYSESFLVRLLRLVEIFTSIATISPYPLSMVQRVANPHQLTSLINLLMLSSPRIKIIVIKVIQNLIKIHIPIEVFEETITQLTSNEKSQVYEIVNKVIPSMKFENSQFLKFLYNYLLSIRHKMWTKSGLESEGQYAVSQEIASTLREILEKDDKHESWRKSLNEQILQNLLKAQELSIQEIDVIFSIISGGDFLGIQPGSCAVTKDNQFVTIIGFSKDWKLPQQLSQQENSYLQKLKIGIDLKEDNQKIVALFFDPQCKERQEIMILNLYEVTPVIEPEKEILKQMAQMSVLNNVEIIRHFVNILDYNKQEFNKLNEQNKLILKQLQLHIIKSMTHMINVCGQDYLFTLQSENLLERFIAYLYDSSEGSIKEKTLVPIDWIELKCSMIKKTAMENDLALIQSQDQMTASVQNNKQLVFRSLDQTTKDIVIQNCYLTSAINLHNVPKDRQYECILSKEITNFNFDDAQGRQFGLVFVDGQELIKLESKSIQMMLHSQAILTTSDIAPKDLFTKMIEEVKKDDQLEEKLRKLEGLLETVILFTKKTDFERVQQPLKFQVKPLFKNAPSAIEGLLRELKEWGEVDRDLILSRLENAEQMTFSKFAQAAVKILKEISEDKQKNKDKLKKLETEKKIKEIEALQKKLSESEKLKMKTYEEKKEKIEKSLGLGGGEVKSLIKQLVEEANDLKNSDEVEYKVEQKEKDAEKDKEEKKESDKKEEKVEYLDILKEEKQKEAVMKLIEKLKEHPKSEDEEDVKKKSADEMNKLFFNSVKGFDENSIASEYDQILDTLTNLYSKKTFSNIINHANLEKLLPFLLRDKKTQKLFTCFIKMQFNEAVQTRLSSGSKEKLKEIKINIDKIFSVCEKDAQYSIFMKNFLFYELIESGKKTVQLFQESAPTKVINYFNTEEKILVNVNPYFLKYLTKIYLKYGGDLVLERPSYIPNLFNIHLSMAVFFQGDTLILKRLYKSAIKILDFVEQNLQATIKNHSLEKLLHNELLHEMIKVIDFDYSEKKYTSQQKLLLEIHLKLLDIHKEVIDQALGTLDTNLENNIGILKVKRGKLVLTEKEKFKFLKYYIHFKNLETHQIELRNQQLETNHYAFDTKVVTKVSMKQVERMDLAFGEKCQLKDFTFVGIANNSKGLNIQYNSEEEIKKDLKEQGINKGEFYLFYPVQRQMVISFGENQKGRLGHPTSVSSTGPKMSTSSIELKPKRIYASVQHSILVNHEGFLYKAGYIKNIGSENPDYTKTNLTQKVRLVALGKTSVVAITEDNKVFGQGLSKDGHIGPNTNYDSYTKMPFGEDEEFSANPDNKIIAIASGTHYTLFVTECGKLYGSGNRFMKEIGLDSDNKIIQIPLPENIKVTGVWACMSKKQPLAIIKVINENGDELLMSAGKNETGLLGQGQGVKVSKNFKPLKYDHQKLKFTEISLHTDHVMAITDNGQIYAWGSNMSKRAGFNEDLFDGVFEPKKVDFLEKEGLVALKVAAGFDHTLVLVQEIESQEEKLFSIGFDEKVFNHLGIQQHEAEDKERYYREITQFRGFKIQDFTAGYRTSYVLVQGEKDPLDKLYEHKIPNSDKIIKGVLHFYKNKEGKFVYLSEEEYQNQKDSLPEICFATKCPILDIENKSFPNLEELIGETVDNEYAEQPVVHSNVKCSLAEKEIVGARYFTFSKINGDDQIINLCEEQFNLPNQFDINPQIYYRIRKPLKKGARLPMIDLKHFFKESSVYGLDIQIKPDLEYTENDALIKSTQQAFDEVGELIAKFSPEFDQELLKEMDRYVKVNLGDKQIGDIKAKDDFKIQDMNFKNAKLKKISEAVKRKRIELYLSFNKMFLDLMPYIEIGGPKKANQNEKGSMSNIFYQVKPLILFSIKSKFIQNQISSLPTGDYQTVNIKRRKAQRFADLGKVDHSGEHTIFGQIYQQVKKAYPTYTNFRKNNTDDKTWSANFEGEGSIDAGGPYRESLSNICAELESDVLPLLIKTPNNRNNHGQNRDCFILNPQSNSPTHLDMFKFLGCLIGFAIRSLSAIPLHLPSMLWKQILADTPDEFDLKGVDTYTWQIIEDLRKQSTKLSDQEFEATVQETFKTRLSDGSEVELCRNGKEKKVTKENLNEYIKLLLEVRFKESDLQLKTLCEGLYSIIPLDMIKILTWEEVDVRCCGDKIIEIAKLKSITNYSCCRETDEAIQRFWRVLEGFTEEEKSQYLKFVWGRSRLPYDVSTLNYKHTIYLCTHRGDKEFPEAHTCFFQLDLPKYTEDDVCKQRLITAITMCGEIDTDGSARWISDDNDGDE